MLIDIPFAFAFDFTSKTLDMTCDGKRVKACSMNVDVSHQAAEKAVSDITKEELGPSSVKC